MEDKSFEAYLSWRHGSQYEGLDDDMPDDFYKWLDNLNADEWIQHAEAWKKLLDKANSLLNKIIKK